MMAARDAAVAILKSADSLTRLLTDIRSDPVAGLGLLTELAGHPEPMVRDWATWASCNAIGVAAVPLLERLAGDRDSDVRSEAMRALVTFDKSWARKFVPRYLRQLKSEDFVEACDAIWRLTQWREPSARSAIRGLVADGTHPVVRDNARVAELVFAADEDALVQGLHASDEDRIGMWTLGLAYLGTEKAIETLRDYSRHALTEYGRRKAAWALRAAERSRPLTQN